MMNDLRTKDLLFYDTILKAYKDKYDKIILKTDHDLVVVDILEHRINDLFYELGFIIRYRQTLRRYRLNLFLPYGPFKDEVKDYINLLSIDMQKELMTKLRIELKKYSLGM